MAGLKLRHMRRALGVLLILLLAGAALLYARDYIRRHPQNVPWTPLDLRDPVGRFTLHKLSSLGERPAQCRVLLRRAGLGDVAAPPKRESEQCGYVDGVRLVRDTSYSPSGLVTACPVAAALTLFERETLQPAAQRHLGSEVVSIDHAGSYSCRRLYGRSDGRFSEHATGDALDIIGFRLADGTRVSVLRDWASGDAKSAFLHDVRDGACAVFATVLSPEYNAAHADHLHFDQASRGGMGRGLCR